MAVIRDLSKAQLAFQVEGGDPDQFLVNRYRGTEGLSQLYRFEIQAVSFDEQVSFDAVVGKPAVLSIFATEGDRWFHGIVSRFEFTGESRGQLQFRIELMPALWLLTHRYNSRIFQNKSVLDIIVDVLKRAGFADDYLDSAALSATYAPREYCVQYRETDFNFISRLLEQEGIFYNFLQTKENHKMVLGDATTAYQAIPDDAVLPFQPPSGMHVTGEHVFRFRYSQEVRPGAVGLNDFNYRNPKLNLRSSSQLDRDQGLEFSDFPGRYGEQAVGKKLAQIRTEEFECGRQIAHGQSNCHRLAPGRKFTLSEHRSEILNAEYLVTQVTHQGRQVTTRGAAGVLSTGAGFDATRHRGLTRWLYHGGQVSTNPAATALAQGGDPLEALSIPNLVDDEVLPNLSGDDVPPYECRFECIPASIVFRPARTTPWPIMRGTQTARVVGPSGEEIHTDPDGLGRVRVQFDWDREGSEAGKPKLFGSDSSCWMRVSQGMAGGGYGMMFLPRVGQEVLVDFLEGDPDRPVVVGRLYNEDHKPPYDLPAEKTKSVIKTHSSKGGGGTNEIRFEDLKGEEQILIYAQKDHHLRVNNDCVQNIDHDYHLTVKEQKFELVKQKKHSEVGTDHNEKIGSKMSVEVGTDLAEKIGGNHGEDVGGNLSIKVTKKVVIDAKEITLKAGGNFVKIDSGGVTILGTKVKINSGGSAGSAAVPAPTAQDSPIDADSAKPGKDTTYSASDKLVEGQVAVDLAGMAFTPDEVEEKQTSWIEIELVDEQGQPIPNEPYEITGPDGETIHQGKLGKDGTAHVNLASPGTCQITFPDLDAAAWVRE